MKKFVLFIMAFGLAGSLLSTPAQAAVFEDFFITADIPKASALSFIVSDVNPLNNEFFTHTTGTALNFAMSLKPALGIYTPARIFAIDLSTSGGAGNPDIDVTYTDTNNPNDAVGGNGLTHKGVATVQSVVGATGSQTVADVGKATLGNINGAHYADTLFAGGFARVLVGIATGNTDPANGAVDPADAEPFTNGDQPGMYQGTLRLTATLP